MKQVSWMMLGLLTLFLALSGMGCDGSGGGCENDASPTPYISGAGIGVSDMERSVEFYSAVLDLEVAGRHPGKLDRIEKEVTLTDRDGQKIFIMDFGPDENYSLRPGKLVFAVPNTQTYFERSLANGGSIVAPPMEYLGTTIALTRDPDGYIIEMIGVPTSERPVLVAVGIGASDLAASRAFFENVVGLTFDTEMAVPGLWNEEVLASPREMGVDLVILDYEKEMDYTDVPAKIVLSTDNAAALADAIAEDNPDNLLKKSKCGRIAYAKDIEGTLMEIIQDKQSE